MKNLYKSLAKFQQEVPVIHEDTNGYNYTYANLNTIFDVIKPLLEIHGLAFTQLLDGKNLKTILIHVDSGETLEGSVEIDTDIKLAGMNPYQVFGSAITYFRRYSLSCVLGLITDKDIDVKGDVELKVKPKLTDDKYKKSLSFTKEQINKVLIDYDLTETQIVGLKSKLK